MNLVLIPFLCFQTGTQAAAPCSCGGRGSVQQETLSATAVKSEEAPASPRPVKRPRLQLVKEEEEEEEEGEEADLITVMMSDESTYDPEDALTEPSDVR